MNAPTIKDLECLICWPPGSRGEEEERLLIGVLLALCEEHGFGRVPQLAAQIEDIWRNPSKVKSFESAKHEHLKMIKEARAEFFD